MHSLLDLRDSIPTFISLSEAAVYDIKAMSPFPVEPGNVICDSIIRLAGQKTSQWYPDRQPKLLTLQGDSIYHLPIGLLGI